MGFRKSGFALLVAVLLLAGLPTGASGQAFLEGPDYKFSYQTFNGGSGEVTARVDWNLYGGAEGIKYWIHQGVIDAGFEDAVKQAFQTWEDDPASAVSFSYQGATTVLSEVILQDGQWPTPSDDVNVVSFNPLPPGTIGRASLGGPFNLGADGKPNGTGTGRFDVSLLAGGNFVNGAVAGAIDVETVVLHELGHALGLDHPTNRPTAVMGPVISTGTVRHSLTPADQFGLRLLYPEVGVTLCYGKLPTIDMTQGAAGEGTAGDDVILGTDTDDVIVGRGGNDTICGQGGNDLILGGDGSDLIHGNSGNDRIAGNTGPDVLVGGPGNDVVQGGSGNDKIYGVSGADVLQGQDGDDEVYGFSGNDKIFGGSGKDFLAGHAGDDLLSGEGDDDRAFGGLGNDDVRGGDGSDRLSGGPGFDTVLGGPGSDILNGDGGNDVLSGSSGNDTMIGGPDDDRMFGGPGNDTCDTSAGFDTTAECTIGG